MVPSPSIVVKDGEANLINSSFVGISGLYGAALAVLRSNVTFSGNTTFTYNQAYVGGAIFSINSSLIFTGSNTFMNNTVPYYSSTDPDTALCTYSNTTTAMGGLSGSGGTIASLCSLPSLSKKNDERGSWFFFYLRNSLDYTEIGINCSFLKISGNSTFVTNQAYTIGGAIITIYSSLILEGLVSFVNNTSYFHGGALAILGSSDPEVRFLIEHMSFINNSGIYGGALIVNEATVFFDSTDESQNSTEFRGNHAWGSGGAIECYGCALFFKSNAIFTENMHCIL